MHNLDQTQAFIDGLETDELELEQTDQEGPFTEQEVDNIATEMLSVADEDELEYFLGGLIKKAAKAAGKFIKSPTGKALGGVLKGIAKKALPTVAGTLGNMVVPGLGGMIGSQLGSAVGGMLELEEGGTQMEFEAAKQLVRTAGAAAVKAAAAPESAPPAQVARAAVASALRQHGQGLVAGNAGGGSRTGRWVRRGNRIILFGV